MFSLSKSSYLKFEQCEKAFYLNKHFSYLKDKIDIDKNLTFNRGHAIGSFAKELFPGGVDASAVTKNLAECALLTTQLIKEKRTIYEATFVFDGVLVMVDILDHTNDEWKAYEVKSSLKVSPIYLMDACLQYYVVKNILHDLNDFFLVTLNGEYVLQDKIDPKAIFKKRSIAKDAEKNLVYFKEKIEAAKHCTDRNSVPEKSIGTHCFKPYTCDFYGHCWKNVNESDSVFQLPQVNKERLFEWYHSGKKNIADLVNSDLESDLLKKVKKAFKENKEFFDKRVLAELLERIKEPVISMDMEIWAPAIPQMKGTRPFQQIPFLFCLYNENTSLHFVTDHLQDGRRSFAEELIRLTSQYKSILVYDKAMEEQSIAYLSQLFPDLEADLTNLNKKMIDISILFKNLHYYHPAFQNNFSLKSIAKVLAPEVNFDGIKSGLEAMSYFEKLRATENPIERELISNDIISYCYNDVISVNGIYQSLQKLQ